MVMDFLYSGFVRCAWRRCFWDRRQHDILTPLQRWPGFDNVHSPLCCNDIWTHASSNKQSYNLMMTYLNIALLQFKRELVYRTWHRHWCELIHHHGHHQNNIVGAVALSCRSRNILRGNKIFPSKIPHWTSEMINLGSPNHKPWIDGKLQSTIWS